MTARRKLIEVALPLEAINKQSAREKSIRHGHPSTLHLWWARRPLATARAVLFAQLVDDPTAREDEFRDEAIRRGETDIDVYIERRVVAERERLFDLITRMVDWDNLNDEGLFDAVRAEIMRSTNGNPPAILDPFAGGGTIPLEAQRLGLEAHASDLNPVAVLINKALIEIPPKFAGRPPVFPDAAAQKLGGWPKATGLAEDVRRYGQWMRDEAERRIGHLYPEATLEGGGSTTVIAWIWARTVICPNPACGIEMPLVRSWWLGKKKGKEAYVVATVTDGKVQYSIGHDPKFSPTSSNDGTVTRTGALCFSCAAAVDLAYVRNEGHEGRLGAALLAMVAEGHRSRTYMAPDELQRSMAQVPAPPDLPKGALPEKALGFRVQAYGMANFSDLFTNRQLVALTVLSDLVSEVREQVIQDGLISGLSMGARLEDGGTDAAAYADAVATYLGLAISRMTDYQSSFASWSNHPKNEVIVHVFGRQAIPMVWDFAEGHPLGESSGSYLIMIAAISRALENLSLGPVATVRQADATKSSFAGTVLSTDPPYYDNIGYSDLSDFFYVWLRRSLRSVHPRLLSTMLVPKAEELVANPFRHGGAEGARSFFENGFVDFFTTARETSSAEDYPATVYYAFKQTNTDDTGTASTGWETILAGLVASGWQITATWPVRTELSGRMRSNGANALASSIVLAMRPRPADSPVVDRRGFIGELKTTLPESLRELQQGAIAPVDLAQAAIGPGMAIFSKYQRVIEPAGGDMGVREALQQINVVLDEVLSQQEGDFDSETRWCLTWFEGHGFEIGNYGEAETLANAKSASVSTLARSGVLSSGAGNVRLFAPAELPPAYDPMTDDHVSLWEITLHMARALGEQGGGLAEAGRILARAEERGFDMSPAHELAYRLFALTEKKGLVLPGILFNALGSSWPELRAAAKAAVEAQPTKTVAGAFDFDALGED